MVRLLEVNGTHYQMGWQHGCQVKDLRSLILEAIQNRLAAIDGKRELTALTEGLLKTLQEVGGTPTIEMIQGQADGLEVGFQRLFRYDVASYLEDNLLPSSSEDCSTWAASKGATSSGEPILVKNRDYYLEHLPLQVLMRAEPESGRRCANSFAYRYLCVGSAGSPGVFGSGINERGLCVADTRVRSLDNGPGLPAYSLMMRILEKHRSVRSALEYLRGAKRMGGSNLILADAQGDLAVFEVGYRNYGIIEADDDIAVNTNHFVSPGLKDQFVDPNPPETQGNSFHRYEKLDGVLRGSHGEIGVELAKCLMASHGGPLTSICRHQNVFMGKKTGTISTAIYLPVQRKLLFRNGRPCEGEYEVFSL
jgi:isopenicillin-N N-acyltransferase-like protein